MYQIQPRKLIIFSSLLAAFLMMGGLNLLKVRENSITGQLIIEPAVDKASFVIIFVLISLIASALVFLTLIYKQNYRY